MLRLLLCCAAVIGLSAAAVASLTPNDVVVVYNSNIAWNSGSLQSKAVADYYCLARGIPTANECGVDWPVTDEFISPTNFVTYIETPLKTFLSSRSGFSENDPGSDPTKCIVLCYGVPLKMSGYGRAASIDSALSLLLSDVPWGREPLGCYGSSSYNIVNNPYYENTSYPSQRQKPADFRAFRSSASNSVSETAPSFTVVRMLDATGRAIAGGQRGILYRREQIGEVWNWVAIPDTEKLFLAHDVSDIFVSGQNILISTVYGAVIESTNGGQTWGWMRDPYPPTRSYDISLTPWTSVSRDSNGVRWLVGARVLHPDSTYSIEYFVASRSGSTWTDKWTSNTPGNDIPASFVPRSVAAVDSQHVWVSGTGDANSQGIWFSDDGGGTWSRQYSASATYDICVQGSTGFAVAADGSILQTADGSNWSAVSGISIPSGSAAQADIAAYDTSHVAVAHGAGSFLVCDSNGWSTDSSDSVSKASVAWSDNSLVVSAKSSGSVIRCKTSSQWDDAHTTSNATWKLRYLVSRLDAYSDPLDTATGIPQDVKNMIDRSVASDSLTRDELVNGTLPGQVIVDDAPNSLYVTRIHSPEYKDSIADLVGSGNVNIVGGDNSTGNPNIYGFQNNNVIAYSSNGSYDVSAHNVTRWYRPLNIWEDGGIGIFWQVSGDGRTLRQPQFVIPRKETGSGFLESQTLKTYLWALDSTKYGPETGREPHWVALHSWSGTGDRNPNTDPVIASAEFLTTEQVTRVFPEHNETRTVWVSRIDLQGLTIPTLAYMAVHYPSDDALHPDEAVMTPGSSYDNIAGSVTTGVTYWADVSQCLSTELIHEGCSGVTGNVYEPFANNCANPQIIIPQYAAGRTWAESAYMGLNALSWMEIVVGDPLMAPYAEPPAVTITSPATDGSAANGTITISASATPSGDATSITRMDTWIESGFRKDGLGTPVCEMINSADSTASISLQFDTTVQQGGNPKYPEGVYNVKVIAFDNATNKACGVGLRTIYINNSGTGSTSVSVSNPGTDGQRLTGTVTLEATVTNPSAVTRLEFWVYNATVSVLAGTDTTPTGSVYSCELSTELLAEGVHNIQAVACCTDGKLAVSSIRSVVITNRPSITISSPASDLDVKTAAFDLTASVASGDDQVVSSVEFFICPPGAQPESLGVDASSPYSCTINPSSYSVGTYTFRAVPRRSGGTPFSNYAERRVVLASGYEAKATIAAARAVPNDTAVALSGIVVSAYGQSSLESAFYASSPDRAAGIRIVSNTAVNTLPAGRRISILGTLHTSGEGEREIVPSYVFTPVSSLQQVKPLYMNIRNLGGSSPNSYTNGADDVPGLYNIGELVRVCGRVHYVGSDFVYIDEGSGGTDGSGLRYYPVPLGGGTIPQDGVEATGVRVYFGSMTKPKLGDYVAVNGVSSLKLIDGQHARYVRATEPINGYITYQASYLWWGGGAYGMFFSPNGSPGNANQPGDRVRVATEDVYANYGDYFEAWMPFGNGGGMGAPAFDAVTALTTSYSDLIVVGTVVCNDGASPEISADAIYRGTVGSPGIGLLSVRGTTSSLPGTYRPLPGPTAEEILASERFNTEYNQPGNIGWVLSQPEDSVLDLRAVAINGDWYNGCVLGLREWFEPIPNGANLLLYLDAPIKLDSDHRDMATIDIIGGTLVTLGDGRRALMKPEAVYVYTDSEGRWTPPLPWLKTTGLNGVTDGLDNWPWKLKVAP